MENNNTLPVIKTDLTVIGAGMAGLSAAIFALNRGFSTVITGKRSSMNFATGLMDLMGVHPSGNEWDNPWEAIDMAKKDIPGHPYCAVKNEDIRQGIHEIVDFLKMQGLSYKMKEHENVNVITSLGTVKKSYVIPESMWKGVTALENRSPSLIIDFTGMKIYSAKQIVSTLSEIWPQLQSARIDFPGMEKLEEVYPEHIARALDVEVNRLRLVDLIKPLLNQYSSGKADLSKNNGQNQIQYLGFPALLGMYKSSETIRQLEKLLGIPIFEIPTPPVSVPGIRLYEALTQGLEKNSNLTFVPEMVKSVEPLEDGSFRIVAGSISESSGGIPVPYIIDSGKKNQIADGLHKGIDAGKQKIVESKAIILATGRFMGKGLTAKRTGIRESLFDLPVSQPLERELWHHKDLFHPHGHPVNRAGIETDKMMRPLTRSGTPFAENIFASGSILANSDWTRMKCGSGVAIATAFASV
ncbi:MAG: anaerobic glycerol-3-phosphate dehydrogenase subunit B, partial [Desulfamplus sp.]|nr:anaerobic glycerol-3-phosphate dehydrogenase subunit B [Desulfamplus sp.]